MSTPTDRHVLVLAYYFPPMGLSGVQRITKLVRYLPENGWRVTVVCPEPGSYFAFDDHLLTEIQETPGVRIVRTRSLDPTRLKAGKSKHVVPFPEESSRRVLSWLSQFFLLPDNKIGWKRYAVAAARKVMKEDPYQLVYATAPPYTNFLAADEIASGLGLPLVLDYRDDWVENPRHTYPTPFHKNRVGKMENRVLRSAKKVYAINETIASAIRHRNQGVSAEISVMAQGFDPSDFAHVGFGASREISDASTETRDQRLPTDVMQMAYTGMFYDAQQPDAFLQALAHLFARREDIRGHIRATFAGLFPQSRLSLVRELGLEDDLVFLGYQSHDRSIATLMESDVVWMIVGRQKGEEMISTGKLYEYMGSQKPILALVPGGEVRTALKGYDAEVCVYPDDIDGISKAIERLYDAWRNGKLLSGNPEHVAQFDRKTQASRIAAAFNTLI
jgi:glycosyltransferase involved in cell wall biosynthesis